MEEFVIWTAHQFDVSAQMAWDIAKCESGFNPLAHNPNDPNDGSHGVFQFQTKTFYGFAEKYGVENPNINNPYQQIFLAIYMLKDGGARHWFNCYQQHLAKIDEPHGII